MLDNKNEIYIVDKTPSNLNYEKLKKACFISQILRIYYCYFLLGKLN